MLHSEIAEFPGTFPGIPRNSKFEVNGVVTLRTAPTDRSDRSDLARSEQFRRIDRSGRGIGRSGRGIGRSGRGISRG